MVPPSPPSLPPPQEDMLHVKTSRPDIAAGLRHSFVVKPLKVQDLNEAEASEFLQNLQLQKILCCDPAQQALSTRLSPMVVESKSYSTGKPIFEAQNQAGVSGSCMTNLQHKFADLAKNVLSGVYRSKNTSSLLHLY